MTAPLFLLLPDPPRPPPFHLRDFRPGELDEIRRRWRLAYDELQASESRMPPERPNVPDR